MIQEAPYEFIKFRMVCWSHCQSYFTVIFNFHPFVMEVWNLAMGRHSPAWENTDIAGACREMELDKGTLQVRTSGDLSSLEVLQHLFIH